jgi:hypothetical protein
MTTQELASQYVEMIRAGRSAEIYDQFYSAEIICEEPEHAIALGIPTVTTGIVAVREKSKARMETIAEAHGSYCTEPIVSGGYFTVAMGREVTFKNGDRRKFDEIAVFGVKDDKIVSETFFY